MKVIRTEHSKETQWGPGDLTEWTANRVKNKYDNGLNKNSPQSYKVVEDGYES